MTERTAVQVDVDLVAATPNLLDRVPDTPESRLPSVAFSLTAIGAITLVLGIGLLVVKAPLPLMMIIGFGVALIMSAIAKVRYQAAEQAAFDLVRQGLPPLLIFVAVGALISSWIHSGTVPTMIYYGMQLISPGWFLPAAIILCAITALVNGTNFATVATIGLALMGVAGPLGIPPGIAAGAILAGAIFGDKMSPLSDTTVMTPGLAGAPLFTHIRHMLWTTVPGLLISLIVFTLVGFQFTGDPNTVTRVAAASDALAEAFHVGWIPLLPVVLVAILLVLRMDAFPAIGLGALSAIPIAVLYQGASLTTVMGSLWNGYAAPKELGEVASLLAGGESGGALKMLGLAAIVIFALAMVGALSAAGIMQTLLRLLAAPLNTPRRLLGTTLLLTTILNMVGGAVNFAAAMGATTLRPLAERIGLAPKHLSRAVEDAANTTGPLIPWNATAVFTAGALGVSVAEYWPWAIFCFVTPVVSLIYALTGFTITWGPGSTPLRVPTDLAAN